MKCSESRRDGFSSFLSLKRLTSGKMRKQFGEEINSVVDVVLGAKAVVQAITEYIENLPEDYISPLLLDK